MLFIGVINSIIFFIILRENIELININLWRERKIEKFTLKFSIIIYEFLIVIFSYLFRDPKYCFDNKTKYELKLRGLWEKCASELYQYQSVNCLTKYFPQDLLPSVNFNSQGENKTKQIWSGWERVTSPATPECEAPLLGDNLWFLSRRLWKIIIFTKFYLLPNNLPGRTRR